MTDESQDALSQSEVRRELERLKYAYDDLRREIRELRAGDTGLSRRRGVLASAGTTAESLLKFIYRREGREKGSKPADKLMLDDLAGALKDILPEHIQVPLRTVQAYRNLGAHDKGDIGSVDEQALLTVNTALNQVIVWFFEAYLGGEFAALANTHAQDDSSNTTNRPALVEWRELYWWLMRGGQLKLLDQKALEKRQREGGLTDAEVSEVRSAYSRNMEMFLQAVDEAFDDGILEDYEVEGLEETRVFACLSEREAQGLVADRLRKVATIPAGAPAWFTRSPTTAPVEAPARENVLQAMTAQDPHARPTARTLLERLGPELAQQEPVPTATIPVPEAPPLEEIHASLTSTTRVAVEPSPPVEGPGRALTGSLVGWGPEQRAPADAWWLNRKVVRKALDELAKRLEPQARALGAICVRVGGKDGNFDGLGFFAGPGVGVTVWLHEEESGEQHFAWIASSFVPNEEDVGVPSPAGVALKPRLSAALLAELGATGPDSVAVPSAPLPVTSLAAFIEAVTQKLPAWSAVLLPPMAEVAAMLPPWAMAVSRSDIEASEELIAVETEEALASFAYNYRVGMAFWHEEKLDQALRYLERAATLAPHHPGPPMWLGWCHGNRKEYASALANFRRVVEVAGLGWPDSDSLDAGAWWASKCGDRELALAAHLEVVRRTPESADAQAALGLALKRVRRLPEAEAALRRSIQLQPKMWAVHLLARILARRGDFAGARATIDLLRKDDGKLPKTSTPLLDEINAREQRWLAGDASSPSEDKEDKDEDERVQP